ncbi:MAG: ribosome biogenesis GTP-binding protein YihA/YsxC [Dongiaceae bacterium]
MAKPNPPDKLFSAPCRLVISAAKPAQFPFSPLPEIAFAGRSNVGKSSFLNSLLGRKLAHTAKTPGRTQLLNFFNLGDRLMLVDMPGYGYAKVAPEQRQKWNDLIGEYLTTRPNLLGVLVLIDSRHGFKPSDLKLLEWLDEINISTMIIGTKADTLKADEAKNILAQLKEKNGEAWLASAKNGLGIKDIQAGIYKKWSATKKG